jgi:hypothetical protein
MSIMTMKGSRYRYMQIEEKRGKGRKHGTTIKTYKLRRWKKGTQGIKHY